MENVNLFKPGNKAWQRRSKHGRDKIFSDPESMVEEFSGYCDWAEKHPWYSHEWKSISNGTGLGSDLVKKKLPLVRAWTMIDFAHYLGVSASWFRNFKRNMKANTALPPQVRHDFLTVIDFIEEAVYNQKYSAAAAGLLKENLIARDLGLAEKSINENINLNGDLSKEQVKQISKDLDDAV